MGFARALSILRTLRFAYGAEEPRPGAAIAIRAWSKIMTRHLTRAHLARSVAGAVSTLVLCAAAAFTIARHLAL